MENFKRILRKMYRMRIKVSREGTPVLNWSVLFAGLCLVFAPHMTLIGSVAAMLLGYQFSFDPDAREFGTDDIEDTVRNAAQNVKSAIAGAAQTVRTEIEKARGGEPKAEQPKAEQPKAESKPVREAPSIRTEKVPETAVSVPGAGDSNREVLEDLERHADEFESNPAATSFHSAYSAMAGSVPTLDFPPAEESSSPSAKKAKSKR